MAGEPIEPDDIHELPDWVAAKARRLRRWTLNRTAHAVVGGTVRPEEDYPCIADSYPCGAADGRIFRPGRMATLTLHPTRGRDLIGESARGNEELCSNHYGTTTVNERGRMAPVVFSQPNKFESDEIFASIGYCTIGDTADRPDDDLLSLCGAGRICGVVCQQLPEWIEGLFDSHPLTCVVPT